MKKLFVMFITLTFFFAFLTVIEQNEVNGYMFRGDLHRIGVYESTVPQNNTLLWSFDTGSSIQSSSVVVGDRVYFGSDNGLVYCLNAFNGDEVWNSSTGNSVKSTPAIVDDVVYIGSTDKNFYAIDADSGTKLWNYSLPRSSSQVFSSPAVVNDMIFFGTDDASLYALNISNSANPELDWEFPTGSYVQSSPAIDWPYVYFGSVDGKVYCLWAINGTQKWEFEPIQAQEIYSTPTISNGSVFIGGGKYNQRGALYCLDAQTGDRKWSFFPPGNGRASEVYSSPAIHNGIVFLHAWYKVPDPEKRGTLYALPEVDPNSDGNITTDEIIWSFITWDDEGGSSPSVADGKVLVGSTNGRLYCINETTGEEHWNLTTGGIIVSSPTVANGIVYITSEDGTLYAVGGAGAILDIEIIPEFSQIKAGRVMGISFFVKYRSTPIEGAFITVDVSDGNLSQYGASTFPDGSQRIKYTAPIVKENSTISVHASVTKFGYPEGESETQFTVEPSSSYEKVSSSNMFSLSKYWFFLVLIVILIILNLIIFILGPKIRNKKMDNKEKKNEN